MGEFSAVLARIQDMDADRFRQSLLEAGIIDETGRLTKKYKRATKT